MAKNKKDNCDDPKKPKPKHTIKKRPKCKKFRPKRNINGFIFFTMCVRQFMQEKTKGKVKQSAVIQQASHCWNKLSNEQKECYAKKAKEWSETQQRKSRCPTCGRP